MAGNGEGSSIQEAAIIIRKGNRKTLSYLANPESLVNDAAKKKTPVKTAFGKKLPTRDTHDKHYRNHWFTLKNCKTEFQCDGCKMKGLGLMYKCEQCPNYNLHVDCMFTTKQKSHDYFNNSTFKFFTRLPGYSGSRDGYKKCEACVKPTPGYVYHCEKNMCNLHPCCFNLPNKLQIADVMFELSDEKLSEKCIWCNQKRLKGSVTGNSGWSYVSTCKNYNSHVYCITRKLLVESKDAGSTSNDQRRLVPKDQKLQAESVRNPKKGGGNIFWKIAKMILKVVLSILMGDPTGFLVPLGMALLNN